MTAFNGRLFAPARTPLASQRGLDDRALGRALCALSTRPADGGGLERITYRDLGVEQLGAVYETVLDYRPLLNRAARAPRGETAVSLEPGSGRRKTTATFYTPRPLAEYLARRTLGPLVDGQPPARILEIKVLDPAMGSGACLVAACGVLAQAYEAALVATGSCHPSDLGPVERAGIRRTIAERCLFGVDVNPTAVELARLSIWLTTLAADRPLSFLDHHLRAGDSILGTWLTLLRRPPAPGRRGPAGPMPLLDEDRLTDTLQHALPLRFALAETPNETIEQVRQKERTLAELEQPDSGLSRWKRVADLWCSSWFGQTAAAFHALSDHILTGTSALPLTTIARCLKAAGITAQARRFFHWELEFPEVFFEAGGAPRIAPGFDAVLGNPPWRMGRGDRMLTTALGFCRQSGVYEAPSEGQANLYQVFVERAVRLTRRGGRLGLVLPSGFASDVGSTPLRRLLFSHTSVDTLLGIDNRRGIFPIHRSVRILLVTATNGPKTRDFECRLGARDLTAIEPDPHGARPPLPVRLTPELLERVSGASLAVPDVRSAIDLVILERAASLFRPLGEPTGWGARFGRDLNATDDRRHLRAAGGGLPVLEGKHLEPFRARVDAAKWRVTSEDARHLLGSRTDRPRLAYRDVASATNRQTLIAALLPAGCASTHTIFCLRTPLSRIEQHFLCAFFNSFVVNYLVRCRVSTHVTTGVVEHLPIPTRVEAGAAFGEIAGLARLLSRGPRPSALAQMNAQVAELYQLTRVEFAHVLDTFPLVEQAERDAALCALTG